MPTGYQDGDKQRSGTNQGGQMSEGWSGLTEDVGRASGAAAEQGRHFLDSAKAQATNYADQRKNDVAQSIIDLASSLHESGNAFEDRPNIRTLMDSAAEGLEQLAETVRKRSVADLFQDVEAVVRRRPATIAVATVAAGFLLARFIRSSAEGLRDQGQQRGSSEEASRQHGQPRQRQPQSDAASQGEARV
jgi:hypothetical protein